MLTKKFSITRNVFALFLFTFLFFLWVKKNFDNYFIINDYTINSPFHTEVSLDGLLYLNLLIISVCTLFVMNFVHSKNEETCLTSFFNCLTSALFISFSIVILLNLFVKADHFYSYQLGFPENELVLVFLVLFFLLVISSGALSVIRKKSDKLNVDIYKRIAVFILIFSFVLMVPAGFLTYQQSKSCNLYVHDFSDDPKYFFKYQQLFEERDGYVVLDHIDKKTLVVHPLTGSTAEVKKFDTKAECKQFIQNKTVKMTDLPLNIGTVPTFIEENLCIVYEGEPKKHLIFEARTRNLTITLPIAFVVTALAFAHYLHYKKICMIKEKRGNANV